MEDDNFQRSYWVVNRGLSIAEFGHYRDARKYDGPKLGYRYICNPLLLSPSFRERCTIGGKSVEITTVGLHLRPTIRDISAAQNHPSAGFYWNMLITQPAVSMIRLEFGYIISAYHRPHVSTNVINGDGVTYGRSRESSGTRQRSSSGWRSGSGCIMRLHRTLRLPMAKTLPW